MTPRSLFRYSGNKSRMTRHLRPPPPGTTRLVEPFLGSGGYMLSWMEGRTGLGCDFDPRVVSLWKWLQGTSEATLRELDAWWKASRSESPPPTVTEIRELFGEGPALYFKINVCGAYVGQWSSETTYPQHELPVPKTLEALSAARQVEVTQGDWTGLGNFLQEGDCVLFDPPYKGTKGNYKDEGAFDPTRILEVIGGWACPVIFTYGEGAEEIFPGLPWEVAVVRQVPRLRGGGTVTRRELVAYLNFPPPAESTLDLFGDS